MYCTTEQVAAILGITEDSTITERLTSIIGMAEAAIDNYCGGSFEDAYRQQTVVGQNSYDIFIDALNLTEISWAGSIPYIVFYLKPTPAISEISLIKRGAQIQVILDGSLSTLDTLYSTKISELKTWLEGLGLEVELYSEQVADYPVWSLQEQVRLNAPGTGTQLRLYVTGSIERYSGVPLFSNGCVRLNHFIAQGSLVQVVYRSGYEEIPGAISEVTAQIAALMYRNASRNNLLEEEELGDYRYKIASGAGSGKQSFVFKYADVLDAYRIYTV